MGKQTPLYDQHLNHGAKIVDFGGWDMPIHYGSQIDEHHAVRTSAGMFDVSHMTVIDVTGKDSLRFLQYLLANDVAKLTKPGKALYSCMLNKHGGVMDDLIVYWRGAELDYRLVVNAGTTAKDLIWVNHVAENYEVTVTERRDFAMIAVQGPNAREKVHTVLGETGASKVAALGGFFAAEAGDYFVAYTGYTGEAGYEIICPSSQSVSLWQKLHSVGVHPCGLGARDTLRLEAGMNLYGQDMDESTSPLEAGLAWTVAWEPSDRDFIGRPGLERLRGNTQKKLVGLALEGRGVLRGHQPLLAEGEVVGEVTSGTFSPTMKQAIGLAHIKKEINGRCQADIRGKLLDVKLVRPPFVRHGKVCLKPL